MKIQKIIDSITPQDALAILSKLASEDADIEKRIHKVAMEYLSEVSIDEVAEQVYSDLDFIDIQDVWNRSGKTEYGYNDPNDVVFEIFEETLEPFIEEMQKYAHLSLFKEARYYCMGVLKGIYRFDKESKTRYREWASDAPNVYFNWTLEKWKNDCSATDDRKKIKEFIRNNFPEFRLPKSWKL